MKKVKEIATWISGTSCIIMAFSLLASIHTAKVMMNGVEVSSWWLLPLAILQGVAAGLLLWEDGKKGTDT